MSRDYYNEFDPAAAAWLRELIAAGELPAGDVDERSIKDVQAHELRGYRQCHFFAGIGIWPAVLKRAGYTNRAWTGSCPCQPFSSAGKGLGFDDPRHLWPDWFRLIAQCRPDTIFGEQSDAASAWLDLVRTDMEGIGAAFAGVDLPAAGFSGAHRRQRLYWVANLHDAERWADVAAWHYGDWPQTGRIESHRQPRAGGAAGIDWLPCRDGKKRPVEAGTFPLAPTHPGRVGLLRGYGNALDFETALNFAHGYMEAEMLA